MVVIFKHMCAWAEMMYSIIHIVHGDDVIVSVFMQAQHNDMGHIGGVRNLV